MSYSKLFLLLAHLFVCNSSLAKTAPSKNWREQMKELSTAFSEVTPELFSSGKFSGKKDFVKKTKKLFLVSRGLDETAAHGKIDLGSDPSLPYLTHQLRENLELAYNSADGGQTDFAKKVLRASVSSCVACHTRSSEGIKLPFAENFAQQITGASWLDRLAFEAAGREFDSVTKQVSAALNAPIKPYIESIQLEKGVRMALAVAVRVKGSPNEALILVKNVLASKTIGEDLKKDAGMWKKDLENWKSEAPVKFTTDADILNAADKIMGGVSATQESTWLPGSEVKYLRSSLMMHELLRKFPKGPLTAEAFYRIGISYDVLQDLGAWSLHEMYYQECINSAPHSNLARRCYEKYRTSVILGYTGSSGTNLPDIVQLHLSKLERLSVPRATPDRVDYGEPK